MSDPAFVKDRNTQSPFQLFFFSAATSTDLLISWGLNI